MHRSVPVRYRCRVGGQDSTLDQPVPPAIGTGSKVVEGVGDTLEVVWVSADPGEQWYQCALVSTLFKPPSA